MNTPFSIAFRSASLLLIAILGLIFSVRILGVLLGFVIWGLFVVLYFSLDE